MSRAARVVRLATALTARACVFTICVCLASLSLAHEVRPAYLGLKEAAPGSFDVLFKTPMIGDLRLALSVSFSGYTQALTPVGSRTTDNAVVQTWRIRASHGLAGQEVRIVGLENTVTDALLRVEFADGRSWDQRLTPAAPAATVPSGDERFRRGGHLLLARRRAHPARIRPSPLRARAHPAVAGTCASSSGAITAFTAAHSITLAAATLGLCARAAEAGRGHRSRFPSPSSRSRSSMRARGRARHRRASALDRGVRLRAAARLRLRRGAERDRHARRAHPGRLAVLQCRRRERAASVRCRRAGARGRLCRLARLPLPHWAPLVPPYLIGSLAMFWVIQRVVAF